MMQEVYEESFMIDEAHPYRFRPPDCPLTIQADAALLKQAVRILIDNAAKYTNPGDEILLGCGASVEGDVYIQVQDTGIGMEEADVQHMFERFYRSDEARAYKGTGLGLSIVKHAAEIHDAEIRVTSKLGKGSVFTVTFPKQDCFTQTLQ
jgi:signal transduction histidine kinase